MKIKSIKVRTETGYYIHADIIGAYTDPVYFIDNKPFGPGWLVIVKADGSEMNYRLDTVEFYGTYYTELPEVEKKEVQ